MTRNGIAAVGVCCGVLGFAVGWLVAPRGAPDAGEIVRPVRDGALDESRVPPAGTGLVAGAQAYRPDVVPSGHTIEALEAERSLLLEQIEVLRRERADTTARIAEIEGRPVPVPADLPERFGQESLVAHFLEALNDTETEGRVEAVDCTEFPCILHGRIGLDGPDDHRLTRLIERLRASYAGDDFYVSQSTYLGDDGKSYQRVAATFYPRNIAEEDRSVLDLRLRHRKNQYMDAPSE